MAKSENGVESPRRFGTFGGVFTPNVLTILGVIMFLRFGHVVGQSGVIYAIAIVLLAELITSTTAISLAAIATNTRLKGGGAYYLISRSLGVEFGGAIGVVFFLAQAISVAMYVIGFTEALLQAFPQIGWSPRTVGSLVNVVVFVCVFIGAAWAIKLQYFILAVLAASILSFMIGAGSSFSMATFQQNLHPHFVDGANFFTMFALFFPAATGIMAGANMSGDLRDPAKSIPSGTFAAIGTTAVIYLVIAVLLAGVWPQRDLIANPFVMNAVAAVPALIVAGVLAATLSSALGSMMGAPRILQAFARDNVFASLRPLAVGSGRSDEPRRAIILTFVVAETAILLGNLDAVASIITMFFMVTYGMLNLACFYESYSNNPSFRPRFRWSHWSTGLAGAVGCGVVMLLMAPFWAVAAMAIVAGFVWLVTRREIGARWGDVQSGVAFERARRALLRLEREKYHPKNWRPIILALTGVAWTRPVVAEYGHWLSAGHGVLSLGQVIGGDVEDRVERRRAAEESLREFIREEELSAFPAVVVEEDFLEGMKALLQCHGIGGMRPNLALFGWADDPERLEAFADVLRLTHRLKRDVVIVKCDEEHERWPVPEGTIDVWWRGRQNGPLMLSLAHLLGQNPEFRTHPIRVVRVVPNEEAREGVRAHLDELIAGSRIEAKAEIVVAEDIADAIGEHASDSAVAFLGFDPPEEGAHQAFLERYENLTRRIRNTILVCSAEDVDLEA